MARLRVYGLSDPTAPARETQAIARAVLAALGVVDPSKHEIVVGPSSGWLSYRAIGELWDRKLPPALPSAAEAKRRAEAALGKLATACSPANRQWPQSLEGIALFPRRATPASLSLTPRPTGQLPDHWLYRAQPELFVDEERMTSVPVMGTLIEIRIGNAGQVISVTSQWRSPNGEELLTDAAPVAGEADGHDHDHDHGADDHAAGNGGAPAYTYVLEGAGLPQHYLAPYIQIADHHGQGVRSGCAFALTVAYDRQQRDRGMTITAVVDGGSGDYAFAWAYYRLEGLEGGIRTLDGLDRLVDGAGGRQRVSSVSLDNGAYVLMINVKDRQTGAFRHFQQQVFSHPLAVPAGDGAGRDLVS